MVNLPVDWAGNMLHVGRIIFGHDVTTCHAVTAVMAGRTFATRLGQCRFSHMNHADSQTAGASLNDLVRATHRHGRQKLAIRQILQMICVAAHSHLLFHFIVVWRQIGIINRPINPAFSNEYPLKSR